MNPISRNSGSVLALPLSYRAISFGCFIQHIEIFAGRQKLGEFIRRIDYNKIKGDVDDPDHPHSKLKELGQESMEDVTFEELKVFISASADQWNFP